MKSFEIWEEIGICIPNPRAVCRIEGPPELLERLVNYFEWVEFMQKFEETLENYET